MHLWEFSVAHSMPGRVRVVVPSFRKDKHRLGKLTRYLLCVEGVARASANPVCASMTIFYDVAAVVESEILLRLRTLAESGDPGLADFEPPAAAEHPAHEHLPVSKELKLSTIGLGLSILIPGLTGLAIPVILSSTARPIFSRALETAQRRGGLTVDTLDATATSLLLIQRNFRTALIMVWLVNLADYIRDYTSQRSRRCLHAALDLNNQVTWIVKGGHKRKVPIDEVERGDIVAVHPGDRIPVDGTIALGRGLVDQSALTGESVPVELAPGDPVFAGSVAVEGFLHVVVRETGERTEAAKIVRLIDEAPLGETRVQNYAERYANKLVPYSFVGAGLALASSRSLSRATTLLIPDYGTGIRVAAPTTILASITRGVREGILIKGGRHLEQLAEIDTLVCDKTGTLTTGKLEILDIFPQTERFGVDQLLTLAGAAERGLNHPVALAVHRIASDRNLRLPDCRAAEYVVGLGMVAEVEGHDVIVGNHRLLERRGTKIPGTAEEILEGIYARAASALFVVVDGELEGILAYADPIRKEAPRVIQELRSLGVARFEILTGDHPVVARQIAQSLGIKDYVAQIFPDQKVERVKELQRQGFKVGFVGDGINDSPALAHADIGIAMHGGADIAREAADVVLLSDDLGKLTTAIHLARNSITLIEENWKLLALPNTAVIALALAGWISPIGATLVSNGAAVLATLNGLRPLVRTR